VRERPQVRKSAGSERKQCFMTSSMNFHHPNVMQTRPPPGLESFGIGHGLHSGSSPPSPQTPVPPPVWSGGSGTGKESAVAADMMTPPAANQMPFIRRAPMQYPPGSFTPPEAAPKPPGLVRAALQGAQREYVAANHGPPPPVPASFVGPSSRLSLTRDYSAGIRNAEAQPIPRRESLSGAAANAQAQPPQGLGNDSCPVSMGSVGHPYDCAGSCRYIKRKGGCRDGPRCQMCHLCFWRRDDASNRMEQDNEKAADADAGSVTTTCTSASGNDKLAALISIGTQGHPHTCAGACRYVRRKTGCRNGAACPNCHACLWRRNMADDKQYDSAQHVGGAAQNVGEEIKIEDSRQALQGLIQLLLQRKEGEPQSVDGGLRAAIPPAR